MAITRKEVELYWKETKSLVLGTVDESGNPDLRHIGGYGVNQGNIYFSTAKNSNKVSQITKKDNVIVLFQKEGQQIPNLRNITVYGTAEIVSESDFEEAKNIIKERRPQANITAENNVIFKITPVTVKVLDFANKENNGVFQFGELV